MCTLTWVCDDQGYDLHFNRDEALNRLPEIPPTLYKKGGVSYISPLDRKAKGTWIALNEHGISYVLLNAYPDDIKIKRNKRSRGDIILSLIGQDIRESVKDSLLSLDLSDFNPFTLVCFKPGGHPQVYKWDTKNVVCSVENSPLTSSSYHNEDAIKARSHAFSLLQDHSSEKLRRYHQGHFPKKGPLSVCVHREDVMTTSYIQITSRKGASYLRYYEGSPCLNEVGITYTF